MPKVSVIIPAYNCAPHIAEAIDSVLAQTYRDLDVIVVDDGSTDDTAHIAKSYGDCVRYIYQTNQERSVARNNGINASTGEYVAFLDCDDRWLPDKLRRQVAVLDAHPDVSMVFCSLTYIDFIGHPCQIAGVSRLGDPAPDDAPPVIVDMHEAMMFGSAVYGGGSTVLARRSTLNEVGLFDPSLNFAEDWDMWVRLSRVSLVGYVPQLLAHYRVTGWEKLLLREAAPDGIAAHERVVHRAFEALAGTPRWDEAKVARLRRQATAMIYQKATMANYQLGRGPEGCEYLRKMMEADPDALTEPKLMQLIVDRAKLIESDSGAYADARAFIHIALNHLPPPFDHLSRREREAFGLLYVSGGFEHYRKGDYGRARELMMNGALLAPSQLNNRGVVSIILKSWLPNEVIETPEPPHSPEESWPSMTNAVNPPPTSDASQGAPGSSTSPQHPTKVQIMIVIFVLLQLLLQILFHLSEYQLP